MISFDKHVKSVDACACLMRVNALQYEHRPVFRKVRYNLKKDLRVET